MPPDKISFCTLPRFSFPLLSFIRNDLFRAYRQINRYYYRHYDFTEVYHAAAETVRSLEKIET